MYSDILVPVDRGIKSDKRCLAEAENIADGSGRIHCLFVNVDSMNGISEDRIDNPTEDLDEYIESSEYDFTTETTVGTPAEEIANYAEKNDMDVIVMNTYNPTGIEKLITGSVTQKTIKQVNRPVLVLSEN